MKRAVVSIVISVLAAFCFAQQLPSTAQRMDSHFQYAVYVNVDRPSANEGEVEDIYSVWYANERMGTVRELCVTNPLAEAIWNQMLGLAADCLCRESLDCTR